MILYNYIAIANLEFSNLYEMKDLLSKYKNPNELFAYLSVSIAVLLYGTTLTATKICMQYYSTSELMAFRMIISAILFLPFFFTVYRNIRIERRDIKLILLMMLCEPCLYFLFETNALKYTTSGQAGIVSSLEPVLLVIAARIILKERFVKIVYLGLFICIIGSILLSLASDTSELAPNPLLGNFLELIAIILTDTCVITTKYLMDRYPPFFLAGVSVFGGAIFFILLNLTTGGSFELVANLYKFLGVKVYSTLYTCPSLNVSVMDTDLSSVTSYHVKLSQVSISPLVSTPLNSGFSPATGLVISVLVS